MRHLVLILPFFLLISCSNKNETQDFDFSYEEPKADVMSISFKKPRNRDLVSFLYDQVLKDDKALKILDEAMLEMDQVVQDSLSALQEFQRYNEMYYSSADQNLNNILDSTMRRETRSVLALSKDQFKESFIEHQEKIKELGKLSRDLKSEHAKLKILISEKMMQKYQESIPSIKGVESVSSEIQDLIIASRNYLDENVN